MIDIASYFNTLDMFSIRLGLTKTKRLAAEVGYPHLNLRFIHIAGTNGKGSVAAMLERALRSVGLTTGLYTSPHLVDIRERFRINGRAVSVEDFNIAGNELIDKIGDQRCTYFEFATILAMKIFERAKCDVVIWETGMGGRLDATNIVRPELTVITNIALDHRQHLGNTLGAIAKEKAGIIKPGRPLFHGKLPLDAYRVIYSRADELDVKVFPPRGDVPEEAEYLPCGQRFIYDNREITLSLPGEMQRENFRIVYEVLDYLSARWNFDLDTALTALRDTRWPARFQLLQDRIILDGGHNPDGIGALLACLKERFPQEKFPVLFAAFGDKEALPSLQLLSSVATKFYFTDMGTGKRASHTPEELASFIPDDIPRVMENDAGLALARFLDDNPTGHVLIAGSLHLAGMVLAKLAKPEDYLDL